MTFSWKRVCALLTQHMQRTRGGATWDGTFNHPFDSIREDRKILSLGLKRFPHNA